MPRADWKYIGVSDILVDIIDEFLKSSDAKSLSLKNRQQFVNHLIFNFFERYRDTTGIDYLKRPSIISLFDLIDSKAKKTKK